MGKENEPEPIDERIPGAHLSGMGGPNPNRGKGEMIQNHNALVNVKRYTMKRSNDLPSHDVTGYPRIKRGDPFNVEKNAQRFAVISMFNFAILKGESKDEAAMSCGYRLGTIILWNRAFQGIETRWPYEKIQGYKYQESL